jgi:hypothetical protein
MKVLYKLKEENVFWKKIILPLDGPQVQLKIKKAISKSGPYQRHI